MKTEIEIYDEMIAGLRQAEEAANTMAFLRSDNRWLAVGLALGKTVENVRDLMNKKLRHN